MVTQGRNERGRPVDGDRADNESGEGDSDEPCCAWTQRPQRKFRQAHKAPKHSKFVRCRGLQMVGVTGNDWLQPAGTFA